MALSVYALDHDVKVAKFCDLGNMVDVQVHEILRYLGEDPDTEVVGLFLEAGGQRDAFRPAAEAVVARKPMIVTLAGLTPIATAPHSRISALQIAFWRLRTRCRLASSGPTQRSSC
jgi:acyl-CoA synthetase (NDP forming)